VLDLMSFLFNTLYPWAAAADFPNLSGF